MSTTIIEREGAICFGGGMAIDADGGFKTYIGKNSNGTKGLDFLANAGTPEERDDAGNITKKANWYGILTDNGQKDGKPIVQGANDPAPGYYISPTALRDKSKKSTDPRSYVDSTSVPYISIPSDLKGAKLGDLCVVTYNGIVCSAIVADIGPKGKYGEGSMALADHLGIPSSPRNGGASKGVKYVVFKGTSIGGPHDNFQDIAMDLFNKWGGLAKLNTVLT